MRAGALGLILTFLIVGCGKNDLSNNDQPSQTAAVAADNSARNVLDRNDAQKADQVAETVRQKAQVSEKAEGNQDLVKDKVTLKKPLKASL